MAERLDTRLDGPVLVQPRVLRDERGFFHESYRREEWAELGIGQEFVQDNHSRSRRGVVRGMHFQSRGGPRDEGMAKLVRCSAGAILDVVVDLRRGSPTFGQSEAFALDDENLRQLLCPVGFAHGFCVLSELADVVYRCDAYYDPASEGGIAYDDPDLGIAWPEGLELIPSARDAAAPRLREVAEDLPFRYEASDSPELRG
ncbi:MAG: dTDP-4-dehydrorhamnose 3,5-epimerase [Thermoleophilaceae bacterium]|jgi:dTDP-4-dehydrorhamnose 3,5-epimerase